MMIDSVISSSSLLKDIRVKDKPFMVIFVSSSPIFQISLRSVLSSFLFRSKNSLFQTLEKQGTIPRQPALRADQSRAVPSHSWKDLLKGIELPSPRLDELAKIFSDNSLSQSDIGNEFCFGRSKLIWKMKGTLIMSCYPPWESRMPRSD